MSAPTPRPASPSPRAPGPHSNSWWIQWLLRPLAWLVGLAVAGGLAATMLICMGLAVIYPNLPSLNGLMDYRPKMPLRVYSADNTLIGEFGEEKRTFQPIAQMPKVMKEAVLAIEDARFYRHGGVDYIGVLRAGLANFGEARSQGASTITMQVARNFYLSTEKTFSRKIYEILLALKIEGMLSKDQILELYMNQIYLGQRAYGFAAACETYFGKPLKDITVAEAAMLAGLPKAPSAYNPLRNLKRATIRQQYILDRMLDNGFITAEQHAKAKSETLVYRSKAPVSREGEYVAEAARALMYEQYGAEAYSRGLNVYTTVKMSDQVAATRALRKGLLDFDRRQAWRGPEAYIDLPADPKQVDVRVAEALEEHPDSDNIKSAVVLSAEPRRVVALLQSGESIDIRTEGLKGLAAALSDKAPPKQQIRRGAVVRVYQNSNNQWQITQLPEVEGALVAIDPRSGEVRAMAGGFDFERNKFNHVTQAWRQPGSSFKPFIYSAALEKGFTPATTVNDAPLFFDAGTTGGQPWEPKNYDGKFEGPMPLRRALAKSKNMVSIRILKSVGPRYAQDWITRFGFEADKHPAYLTMALGAGSVTPLQMADAYAVFANGGYRVNPTLVTRVTDSRNAVLAQHRPAVLDESMRAIDARNAFLMSSLLQEVTRSGTAARAQASLGRPDLYGKTGTTNDSMDAWFAGYTARVVAVVWIGHDQPRKLGDKETGGGLALPVWIDFMRTALRGMPVEEPTPPEGVINIGGEWFYEEYTAGTGVRELTPDENDAAAPDAPNADEKRSILDLFGGKPEVQP
ncbi:MAG TPA: penicillin-binding protein 1A [Aquabacterium sp.]|uniref:penicillin-binding protein 1A n=1 Tax=Aquabacterium sp. TaxID=1872578 RepID=UPI002E33E153|nr:penicillin-binding protein 1A [Aquabacterium sp.]HEX5373299.1 penicillin-binding protein 1A [Aquabacterium sp.]